MALFDIVKRSKTNDHYVTHSTCSIAAARVS